MPTTEEWKAHFRAKPFTPLHTHRALAMRVLIVATTRLEGTWKAYADAVPGMTHDNEWQMVLRNGDELPEAVARVLFPFFEEVPYAR